MHCRSLLWRTAPLPSAIRATSKSDGSSIRRSWRCEYEKKRAQCSLPIAALKCSGSSTPHDLRHLGCRRGIAAALGADDAVDDGHADAGEVAELHAVEDVLAGGM